MSNEIIAPRAEFEVLEGAKIFNHNYIPVAAACCRKLKWVNLHLSISIVDGLE